MGAHFTFSSQEAIVGFKRLPRHVDWHLGDDYVLTAYVGELDDDHREALAALLRCLQGHGDVFVGKFGNKVEFKLMGYIPDDAINKIIEATRSLNRWELLWGRLRWFWR